MDDFHRFDPPLTAGRNCESELLVADSARPCDALIGFTPQLSGMIHAQPSKNYTTRYLLAAALAEGTSTIRNCATSEDSRAMQSCLRALGAEVEILTPDHHGSAQETIRVQGFGGKPRLRVPEEPIDVGNAGAVLRLLLGTGALLPQVTFITQHHDSLGKRPNADLLDALRQIGCKCEPATGYLPIRLRGGNLRGGRIEISGARSSQFLSSLLFLAPLLPHAVQICVIEGLVSKAPIRQTLEVLRAAGIQIDATPDLLHFNIPSQPFQPGDYTVNGDWPGSAAILASAAATGSSIAISGLLRDEQGEKAATDILTSMGARIESTGEPSQIRLHMCSPMKSVEFDGDLATDAVLALVGAACFAEGKSRFYNVANLRLKECDRITEPLQELRKIGVHCWEGHEVCDSDPNAIIIKGDPEGYEGDIDVDGRGDHRVIMLLTSVGLRCRKGLRIKGAHHVAKSYPHFFSHMRQLGAAVELVATGQN